jgi:hypothetical protein
MVVHLADTTKDPRLVEFMRTDAISVRIDPTYQPARRFSSLGELDSEYADWRDEVCNQRRHASGHFPVEQRLEEERRARWSASIVRVPELGDYAELCA